MPRGTGLSEAIRELATEPVLLVAALVTLAGDAATLLVISVGVYWLATPSDAPSDERPGFDRRRGAFVIACVLGALSLTAGLKAFFSLPRPPGTVLAPDAFAGLPFATALRTFVDWAASASGFGFPSGHAVGSTVTYGALALTLAVASRRQRWTVAAFVIALVSLSRVVLGVHYLVDVLVGCAVGLAYLGVVVTVARTERALDPARAFGLAVLIGGGAFVVSAATLGLDAGTTRDAVTLLGVSVGAGALWLVVDDTPPATTRRERLGIVITGVVAAGVPGVLTYVLDPAFPVEFVFAVLAGGAAVATPRLARKGMAALGMGPSRRSDQNVSR